MAIFDVVKYEGGNDVLAWKHPAEDFNTKSQLIVHESQEAVFFKNGQALDLFTAGRYTLDTQNIPILGKLINLPFGGVSPFHCEVYYINKVVSMDILWGTNNPIPVKDAVYGIILPIGANGQFGVRIADSRKFLTRLVGTVKEFNQDTLRSAFRGILLTKIKDYIANQFVKEKITFLEIHAHIDSISQAIRENLAKEFETYGIELVHFNVNAITVPEDDPSYLRLKQALAKKAEMGIIGYNYQQERTFDVLEGAATNEGAGAGVMGAGMGVGMGLNLGQVIGSAFGGAVAGVEVSTVGEKAKCVKCGETLAPGAKFCPGCGAKVESAETLTCPKCGETTPPGKFCIHCGFRFADKCPRCNASLTPGAKFCPECGERLGE